MSWNIQGDENYSRVKQDLEQNPTNWKFDGNVFEVDVILRYLDKMYIPDMGDLRKLILEETHNEPYLGHPRVKKMVVELRSLYF